MKPFFILFLSIAAAGNCLATLVVFPVVQMFGTNNYDQPFRIDAARPLLTDGTSLFVGSYTQVTPSGGTNPIVTLTPNDYLVTFKDSRTPWRISVTNSSQVLNALQLTSGPLPSYLYQPAALTLVATNDGRVLSLTNPTNQFVGTFNGISNLVPNSFNGGDAAIGGNIFAQGLILYSGSDTNGDDGGQVFNPGDGSLSFYVRYRPGALTIDPSGNATFAQPVAASITGSAKTATTATNALSVPYSGITGVPQLVSNGVAGNYYLPGSNVVQTLNTPYSQRMATDRTIRGFSQWFGAFAGGETNVLIFATNCVAVGAVANGYNMILLDNGSTRTPWAGDSPFPYLTNYVTYAA